MELRGKMSVLQQELMTSEAVQKDFVRLSQSLQVIPSDRLNGTNHLNVVLAFQMELEKIRAADTAVRWQDDEDVDSCPSCKNNFTVTRRKVSRREMRLNIRSNKSVILISSKIAATAERFIATSA